MTSSPWDGNAGCLPVSCPMPSVSLLCFNCFTLLSTIFSGHECHVELKWIKWKGRKRNRNLLIVPCGIEIEAFEAVRALKKLLIVDATYRTTWIWKSCDLSNRKAFSRLFFRPKTARFAALFTWIRTNGKTHISRVYFFMLVQIYSLEKM